MGDRAVVRADQLAALELFAGCAPEDLSGLATALTPWRGEAGEVIIRQGDPAVAFLLIESGRGEVSQRSDGVLTVLNRIGPGAVLGEIALLRETPRSATVTAVEPVSGWSGDRDAFAAMVAIPGVLPRLVRIARQRLAASITPVSTGLRRGTTLMLRPVLPGDNERTAHGPVEFSSETLYRRFLTSRTPSKKLMQYLFEVDYVDHFVWIVTDGVDGPVVADARFVRDEEDPTRAEIAFIVGDAYQHRGLGTFLMGALAIAARLGGVETFTARVLAENFPMRNILDRYGARWVRDDLSTVTTEIAVPHKVPIPRAVRAQVRELTYQVARAVD